MLAGKLRAPASKQACPTQRLATPRISSRCARQQRLQVNAVAMEAPSTLRTYQYSKLNPAELKQVLARPRIDFTSILNTVSRASTTTYAAACPEG